MSWRERLQKGSIDDLLFHTEKASGRGGRRVVVHEYPQQEEHWAEDMGRAAGEKNLEIFLIGRDYDLQREQMFKVLDAPGTRKLVHPYLGTQRIQVIDYDWNITTRKGGYCSFTIKYVDAGKRKFPIGSHTQADNLRLACDNSAVALQTTFSNQFSVVGSPGFVQQNATDQLTSASDALNRISGQLDTLLQPVNDLTDQIDLFANELTELILKPQILASQVGGLIATAIGGVNQVSQAFTRYQSFLSDLVAPFTDNGATPSRKRQVQNQVQTQQLMIGLATVEFSRVIADRNAQFDTYEQAMQIRDYLLTETDHMMESASDLEYTALAELQATLIRRIDQIAPGLARIEHVTLQLPLPSLVLAHKLYGDSDRSDELIRRNQIKHPLFLPAGTALEVLQ